MKNHVFSKQILAMFLVLIIGVTIIMLASLCLSELSTRDAIAISSIYTTVVFAALAIAIRKKAH